MDLLTTAINDLIDLGDGNIHKMNNIINKTFTPKNNNTTNTKNNKNKNNNNKNKKQS